MGSFIAILFLIGIAWIGLQILGGIFHLGAFLLTIPFKIIGLVFGIIFTILLIPFKVFFALLQPLFFLGIICVGLYYLARP